jgi:hypothetical protein
MIVTCRATAGLNALRNFARQSHNLSRAGAVDAREVKNVLRCGFAHCRSRRPVG